MAGGQVILVYGSDDLTASRTAAAWVEKLCPPEEQAFGLETFEPEPDLKDGAIVAALLDNVREAVATPSFLGGKKTVFLKNGYFFCPRKEPGNRAAVQEAVGRLTEMVRAGLPDGVSLVLLLNAVDKTTAFYKACLKHGQVVACEEPVKEKDAKADFLPRVAEVLAEKGISMPRLVLTAFLARTGYSLRLVESEIEKLSLYLGDRKQVTADDLDLMVPVVKESQFWEFADVFCTGNLEQTLRALRRMYAQRIAPVPLVVNLQNRLRELLVLRDCLDRGLADLSGGEEWRRLSWKDPLPPEEEELLSALEKDPRKIMPPFRAAMMAAQAAKFPAGRWMQWLSGAVQAQMEMTGGSQIPAESILELFVIRALSPLRASR